jgi:hypothetical protein
MYRGIIQSVGRDDPGSFPNDWRIVIDVGFFHNAATTTNIAIDDWISPASEHFATYVETTLATFAYLGPAEKTTIVGLLPRALRKPSRTSSNPSELGAHSLRRLILSGSEVQDAAFLVAPSAVPVASGYQLPPKIATPQRLAFYPSE